MKPLEPFGRRTTVNEAVEAPRAAGGPGDGIVFVTPVERAIKIRTWDEAPQAPRP